MVNGKTAATIIDNCLVAIFWGKEESLAWTVNVNVPAAVGAPDKTPVLVFKVIPAGKAPREIDQIYGFVPPDADNVWEYAAPVVPPGNVVVLITNAGVSTVTVADFVTAPEAFVAVKMYVVVEVGETVFDVVAKTEPTELLMDSAVGVPPESVQDKTADCPAVIVAGVATNVEITGAKGLTVTVTNFFALPQPFFSA